MAMFPPHLAEVLGRKECPGGKKHVGPNIPAIRCYQCRVEALREWEEELKRRAEEKKGRT